MAVYLLMTHVETSEFSVDTMVTITVGVLDRYLSSCVYLLYATHQRSEYLNSITSFLKFIYSTNCGTLYLV
jgi:hypothetical protein